MGASGTLQIGEKNNQIKWEDVNGVYTSTLEEEESGMTSIVMVDTTTCWDTFVK